MVSNTLNNSAAKNKTPVTVWRFTDDHPGHDNQSQGLVSALSELLPVRPFDFNVKSVRWNIFGLLFKRFPNKQKYPLPDLLIGAGHGTHWPMLAARRTFGGRIIVLMKPSLPINWFDAAVVPRHDNLSESDSIFLTVGALNTIHHKQQHQPGHGLVLLGGPSAEYSWQTISIAEQISTLIRQRPEMRWTVTSSRRTPAGMMEQFSNFDNVRVLPYARCESGWLAEELAQSGEVWVTEDSVSMLCEALSSGARVGVIKVPRAKQGRVASGIDVLVNESRIPEPGSFQLTRPDAEPLQEAMRCAQWIKQRWIDN